MIDKPTVKALILLFFSRLYKLLIKLVFSLIVLLLIVATATLIYASYLIHNPSKIETLVHKLDPSTKTAKVEQIITSWPSWNKLKFNIKNTNIQNNGNQTSIASITSLFTLQYTYPFITMDINIDNATAKINIEPKTNNQPITNAYLQQKIALLEWHQFFNNININNADIEFNYFSHKKKHQLKRNLNIEYFIFNTTATNPNLHKLYLNAQDDIGHKLTVAATVMSNMNAKKHVFDIKIQDNLTAVFFTDTSKFISALSSSQNKPTTNYKHDLFIKLVVNKNNYDGHGNWSLYDKSNELINIPWKANFDFDKFIGIITMHQQDKPKLNNLQIGINKNYININLNVIDKIDIARFNFIFYRIIPKFAIKSIEGKISNTAVSVTLKHQNFKNFKIENTASWLTLHNVGYNLAKSSPAPEFHGITGKLISKNTQSELVLNSNNFVLDLPNIFSKPFVFDKAKGKIITSISDNFDGLNMQLNKMKLWQNTGKVNIDLEWNFIADKNNHSLNLDIGIKNTNAKKSTSYFPDLLFPKVGNFINTNIKSGVIKNGKIGIKLTAGPKGVNSPVDVDLNFIDTTLSSKYIPTTTKAKISLKATSASTNIKIHTGDMQGLKIKNTSIDISHADNYPMIIEGKASGTIAQARQPIMTKDWFMPIYKVLHYDVLSPFDGNHKTKFKVTVYLKKTNQNSEIDVVTKINNLHATNWYGQKIRNSNLDINYKETTGLKVYPRKIIMNNKNVTINDNGTENIIDFKSLPLLIKKSVALHGLIMANGKLIYNRNKQNITISTDLDWRKAHFKIPALAKKTHNKWLSQLTAKIHIKDKPDWQLTGFVEDLLFTVKHLKQATTGCILLDNVNAISIMDLTKMDFILTKKCATKTNITANNIKPNGVDVIVDFKKMNLSNIITTLDITKNAFNKNFANPNQPNEQLPNWLRAITASVKDFTFSKKIPPSSVKLKIYKDTIATEKDNITASIQSNTVTGTIVATNLNNALNSKIIAILDNLTLNTIKKDDKKTTKQATALAPDSWHNISPAIFPDADIYIQKLILDKNTFGNANATITKHKTTNTNALNLEFNSIKTGLVVNGMGSWHQTTKAKNQKINSTKFKVNAKMNDLILSNKADIMAGTLQVSANWLRSPVAYDSRYLNADIKFILDELFVEDKELDSVNAFNVIGILNIVEIADLLKLSVRDKKNSVFFKKITGDIDIKKGLVSHNKPLFIDSIGFSTSITGTTDIFSGELDLDANIKLKLDNTITMATFATYYPAIIANPIIGIPALYLADKFLSPSITSLTSLNYKITGNFRKENKNSVIKVE